MNVRELIMELLQFNPDASVSLNGLYEESETIHFSWSNPSEYSDINESKRECTHLFLETSYRNDEDIENGV